MISNEKERVLVTGSSGFIGTNLLEVLLRQGYPALGVDMLRPRNVKHFSSWKKQDLLNSQTLGVEMNAFAPDIVIHLGARTDLDGSSVNDYAANHIGTQIVTEVAGNCPSVKRVLFASSRLVNRIGYDPKGDDDYCPTTHYGESKAMGEQIIREAKPSFEWAIVRPTSIWGPWFGIPYRTFFDAVLAGRYVHPKGLRVKKSFGYVENAVFELMCLMRAPVAKIQGSVFYITDYKQIEVFDFAKEIARQAGKGAVFEVPLSLLKAGAKTGDVLKKFGWTNPPLTSFRLDNLMTDMNYRTDNLEPICGTLPFDRDSGISRTLQWMKKSL